MIMAGGENEKKESVGRLFISSDKSVFRKDICRRNTDGDTYRK